MRLISPHCWAHTSGDIVINRDWAEGMGSSVRTGIARVPAAADAALLMLADQPAVTTEDLRRLVGSWRRQTHCIVAAQYSGTTGVPAIFPREDFAVLSALRGDAGARALLKRGGDRLVRVPLQSAAIDIDTPEDLLKTSAGLNAICRIIATGGYNRKVPTPNKPVFSPAATFTLYLKKCISTI